MNIELTETQQALLVYMCQEFERGLDEEEHGKEYVEAFYSVFNRLRGEQ